MRPVGATSKDTLHVTAVNAVSSELGQLGHYGAGDTSGLPVTPPWWGSGKAALSMVDNFCHREAISWFRIVPWDLSNHVLNVGNGAKLSCRHSQQLHGCATKKPPSSTLRMVTGKGCEPCLNMPIKYPQ